MNQIFESFFVQQAHWMAYQAKQNYQELSPAFYLTRSSQKKSVPAPKAGKNTHELPILRDLYYA